MSQSKVNAFGKLGRLITKRKFTIIAVWLLLLAIILPIVLMTSGATSLAMNSSTDTTIESEKAGKIISAQFQKSVSNDSLIIIISTDNASSISTQRFIDSLVAQIKSNFSITGLENVTSVYSILIPALNQTNQGVYVAYYNGNLTYNLLYSVPTIYSNVWYQAYNQTKNGNLVPGLNQTNQGVYTIVENANLTYNMLYSVPAMHSMVWSTAYNQTRDTLVAGLNQTNEGVYTALENANLTYNMLYSTPAIYLNAWSQNYSQTSNVDQANQFAYQATAATLHAADSIAYAQFTSHLLDAFNATWVQSFIDSATSAWTPVDRATFASNQTNQLYVNTFLAGNATNQAFATAVANNFTLTDYLTNDQTQNNAKLMNFAIQFVTDSSGGQSSTEFVTASYNIGDNPTPSAFSSLAETIFWNPDNYQMGTNFIATLNEAAYNQTATMLSQADPDSYEQYIAPLLNVYNATWTMSFQDSSKQTFTPFQRASFASNITNQQYIDNFLGTNASEKAFVSALKNTFSLNSFLTNSQDQNNAQLRDFSIQFVANQSGASNTFVNAAYNLGNNPSSNSLSTLADRVIWYSSNFNMSSFVSMFNGLSYDQTKSILKAADESSFNDYTSHLLDMFNASWSQRVPSQPAENWINQTASAAADVANSQFINAYLSDSKDFADHIVSTFSLQDYLNGNITDSNAKLKNLTINYVSNQSDLSRELITAIYDIGENASSTALQTLSSNIICSPSTYNIGEQFNSLVTSFVSPSKDVTLISLSFDQSKESNLLAIRSIIASNLAQNPDGVQSAQVTGSDALDYDFMRSTFSDVEIILPITIALLLIATGLFFRSIVTPLITLGTIGVGLGVSQIFPYLVGTYINSVDYTTTTVLLTVLIGVGTDYSIFILARHREERINSLPLLEAIKKSITWAGESIVTSGTTVIISFLALAITSMVMLQTMGLVVGLGVIATLLASLTFAPALTAIFGDKIFWPNSGVRFERYVKDILEKNKRRGGYFTRSGSFSVKHGKVIILIAVLVTLPAFYLYATTTPTYNLIGSASNGLESVSASNTLTNSFGGGRLMPTYAVVTFSQPLVDSNGTFNMGEMATLQSMSIGIASHLGVEEVNGPTMPFGRSVDYQTITNASDPTTYNSMLGAIGADSQSALITIKFNVDPYSTDAMNFAKEIRNNLHQNFNDAANVTAVYLGGTTGNILDMRIQFENQFNSILPIVALGVGLVLFVVLGSLILPVFAIVSVLMSIVWTLAVTVLVFNAAFSYGLLFITPLILFVLLLGLGMDYNIFILTRIREEATKGQNLNNAIVHAIQQTGGIITAAAIILAGSLGTLMLSSNMMLKEMGFAFAFSILIDALVVRTYIVPAVMSTFGKWNWYSPIKRLRRLDNLDEEQSSNQNSA